MRKVISGYLIIFRWVEIVILGALHFFVFEVLLTTDRGAELVEHILGWPPLVRNGLLALLSTGFFTVALRLGALGPYHFCGWRYLRYPPLWFAPLVGLLFSVLHRQLGSGEGGSLGQVRGEAAVGACAVLLGLVLTFIFEELKGLWESALKNEPSSETQSHNPGTSTDQWTDADLLEWILREDPIRHPTQDLLSHRVLAERMAERLLSSESASVGLTGPYGSGKSSVINMVKHYLQSPESLGIAPATKRQIVCCHVRGWGRDSENIAQQTLHIIVHELRKYVDMSALVGLPASYHRALGMADTLVGSLATVLTSASPEPLDQLQRLDNILAVSNLRVVLFLEDLDRDLAPEMLKIEVPGLLDRLRDLQHVSFVIAVATERYALDSILRICEYTETLA